MTIALHLKEKERIWPLSFVDCISAEEDNQTKETQVPVTNTSILLQGKHVVTATIIHCLTHGPQGLVTYTKLSA